MSQAAAVGCNPYWTYSFHSRTSAAKSIARCLPNETDVMIIVNEVTKELCHQKEAGKPGRDI